MEIVKIKNTQALKFSCAICKYKHLKQCYNICHDYCKERMEAFYYSNMEQKQLKLFYNES